MAPNEPYTGEERAWVSFTFLICALTGVLGWKGCSESTRTEGQRAGVQIECLKANHTALECKELR